MTIHLYQIFYNEETLKQVCPKFIPYDNSDPIDSTWFEYSAIRDILKNNIFKEDDYLGIFSPKFESKTGLSDSDVFRIIEESNAEVISFSSAITSGAFYLNPFLQGEDKHPGLLDISQKVFNKIGIKINLQELVQDQTRIIFSNFFVAKYSFWRKWFEFSEKIYLLGTDVKSKMYAQLNMFADHRGIKDQYQMKIFLMERLVSAILENTNSNAQLGLVYEKYSKFYRPDIIDYVIILDSLKSQFIKTKKNEYLDLYRKILKR